MFKVQRSICPSIFSDIFHRLRATNIYGTTLPLQYRMRSPFFKEAKICLCLLSTMSDNVINELTKVSSVEDFKTGTENEKLKTVCRGYVRN